MYVCHFPAKHRFFRLGYAGKIQKTHEITEKIKSCADCLNKCKFSLAKSGTKCYNKFTFYSPRATGAVCKLSPFPILPKRQDGWIGKNDLEGTP
ncbi:MAG: hypothetical protein Q4G52_05120 [Clostridia bacterium]|nr:hypothetical protein [Clostridia bacterium]